MRRTLILIGAVIATCSSASALAQADGFTLVNGTGQSLRDIAIRRFNTRDWRPLGLNVGAGGSAPVTFASPDCVFDMSATLPGGTTAIWSGVNLCEVDVLRLNREPSGELWVDYN